MPNAETVREVGVSNSKVERAAGRLAMAIALGSLAFSAMAHPARAQEVAADAQPSHPSPVRMSNGLALTPPMGWNSWNRFACNVNEDLIRKSTDAMVASGMKAAGYEFIVIDDCWHGERDAQGNIQADPVRFPSGLKALGDYIHARGLKFGIYSDAGRKTCGGRPGSQGHEFQDARQYAAWGVDYLKYDWCNTGTRNAEEAYTLMSDALRASGRDIVFSLCEWGNSKPWNWASRVGNLWRTTGDIYDAWDGKRTYSLGIMNIVDLNEPLHPFAGPGHWNDPDMLEVGNGGMSDTEYRAHFSLWAMMSAPLMAGNDLAAMDEKTKAILLNREVIAINQDKRGVQGRRVRVEARKEVWSRPLEGGGRAVILLNRGDAPADMTVDWADLDYPATLKAKIRDLWAHSDLPARAGSFSAQVPAHGVVMVKLQP